MKFGLAYNTAYYGADPDLMAAAARHAEECGFESFYLPEHIVLYPGASAGPVSFTPDLAVADPLECLAYVAAVTSELLLGTAVLLLPYHHPVVLAKRLATIDMLSRGRMSLLTVGLGTLPGEAAAAGVDFGTRGRRADEAIEVLRLLWGGDAAGVSFRGRVLLPQRSLQLPQAAWRAHPAGPCRRIEPGCRPAGGPPRRRLLPRWQADAGAARRADRGDAGGSSCRRTRSRGARVHPLGTDRHDGRRGAGPGRSGCHPAGRQPRLDGASGNAVRDIFICPPPGAREHERRPVIDTATRSYGTSLRQGF